MLLLMFLWILKQVPDWKLKQDDKHFTETEYEEGDSKIEPGQFLYYSDRLVSSVDHVVDEVGDESYEVVSLYQYDWKDVYIL